MKRRARQSSRFISLVVMGAILLVVLGSLLSKGCSLLLTPPGFQNMGGPAISTCSDSALDLFEGCFGDPEGDYIHITPGDAPTDSEYCIDFLFSGDGSGIIRSPGDNWHFTGSLIEEDRASISGDFSDIIRLSIENTADRLTVKIWDAGETRLEDDTLQVLMSLDRYTCPE